MDLPFPVDEDPSKEAVADWVEFQALARRHAFKRGDLRSAISVDSVTDPDLLEFQVWDVLGWRSKLFGPGWPLRITESRISRRSPSPVNLDYYRYLLCLGLGLTEKPDRELFELLVASSLTALTSHASIHVGHPASRGMDSSFRKRIDFYARSAKLLPVEEVIRPPFSDDKDMGLDAVSWIPFHDERSGYLHFLAQCATGADWDQKFEDIRIERWKRHINWAVPPIRVFSVPFAITMLPERWVRMCTDAGLVLDRPRLVELERRRPVDKALIKAVRLRLQYFAA